MSANDARQKDILLLLFAVQLSLVGVRFPDLFALAIVGGIITLAVMIEEASRRLDEYSGR